MIRDSVLDEIAKRHEQKALEIAEEISKYIKFSLPNAPATLKALANDFKMSLHERDKALKRKNQG